MDGMVDVGDAYALSSRGLGQLVIDHFDWLTQTEDV